MALTKHKSGVAAAKLRRECRPITVDLESCTACRTCEYHCPDFAISVSFREERRRVTAGAASD